MDQRQRLEAQQARKAAGDLEAQGLDEDFVMALEVGMLLREVWGSASTGW